MLFFTGVLLLLLILTNIFPIILILHFLGAKVRLVCFGEVFVIALADLSSVSPDR